VSGIANQFVAAIARAGDDTIAVANIKAVVASIQSQDSALAAAVVANTVAAQT
jgi:hypothetical protein